MYYVPKNLEQIENVFFNLTVENNTILVKVEYTFLSEEIEEKLKANKNLNFKRSISYNNIQDLKLLFNITSGYEISTDFVGTEYLHKANKNTLDFVKFTVSQLMCELTKEFPPATL